MDPDQIPKSTDTSKPPDFTKDVNVAPSATTHPWGTNFVREHDAPSGKLPIGDADVDKAIEALLGPGISEETGRLLWNPIWGPIEQAIEWAGVPAALNSATHLYANSQHNWTLGDPTASAALVYEDNTLWQERLIDDRPRYTNDFDLSLKQFGGGAGGKGSIFLPWLDWTTRPVDNTKSGKEIAEFYRQERADLTEEMIALTEENPDEFFQFYPFKGIPKTRTGADLMYDTMETPEWLQIVGELTHDPVWGIPTKLRYLPVSHLKGMGWATILDKIFTGKYIPTIFGGFDWMKVFSKEGALKVTDKKIIDDLVEEAKKLDKQMEDGDIAYKEGIGWVPKRVPGHVPVPDLPVVKGFLKKLKEAVPLTKEQKKSYKDASQKRIAALNDEINRILAATDDYPTKEHMEQLWKKHLSGEMEKVKWTPLVDSVSDPLTTADVQELTRFIRKQGGGGYEFVANMQAFYAVVYGGQVPQPRQIVRLENLFGTDFAKSLVNKEGKFNKTWKAAIDVLGIPRTLVSSFDLSAPLRQGRVMGHHYPKEFREAFTAMHKSIFSEQNALAIEESIKRNRYYGFAEQSGLHYSERSGLAGREEAFMSNYIKKVPLVGEGVEASERAYTIFLNKFRHDIFYKTVEEWHAVTAATGKRYSIDDYRDLSKMINYATGRGPGLGNSKWADIANAAFFAPRFATSQLAFLFQGGKMAWNRNGAVSKVFAESLVGFTQSSMMWLHVLDLAGAEVELDPRSSDFGKGKFGNHRFDFFGGYLPIVRYTIQLGTGEKKSSMGDIYEAGRLNALGRWLESKMSPSGAAGYDLYTGENFLGEEVDMGSLEGVLKEGVERLVPMLGGDIIESWKLYDDPSQMVNNIPTISSGLLFSLYGGGFQSYESTAAVLDKLSNEFYPGTVFLDHEEGSVEHYNITHSTAYKKHFEHFREDPEEVPGRQAWSEDIADYQYFTEKMLEGGTKRWPTGFIYDINNLPYGREKRQTIEEFFRERNAAWGNNIRDHAAEWKDEQSKNVEGRERTVALLRDRYWDIPLTLTSIVSITNERVWYNDYDEQDRDREAFMQYLGELGIVETHIDGSLNRNGNVYIAIATSRPIYPVATTEDPEKRKFSMAIDEYRKDEKFLRENYFELDKQYFQHPDSEQSFAEYAAFMSTENNQAMLMGRPDFYRANEVMIKHNKNIQKDRLWAKTFGWGELAAYIPEEEGSKAWQEAMAAKNKAAEVMWLLLKWDHNSFKAFWENDKIPEDLKAVILKRYEETFGTTESQTEQHIVPEHLRDISPAYGGIKMGSSEYR